MANSTHVSQIVKGFKPLKTSQRETISDGTIVGLKDVIYENQPDLTYFCQNCQLFINLLSLRNHHTFHDACRVLGYDAKQIPKSSRSLLKRRNTLLNELKQSSLREGIPVDITQVHYIDNAYELVKQEIEDTFQSCRKIDEGIDSSAVGSDVACSVDFVEAIGFCTNQNSRWKPTMEDTKVYQDYYGNDPRKAFLALYDGNNGLFASAVAANELHYLLLNELSKFDARIFCQCTFNMFEVNDISQYDLIRPPSVSSGNQALIHKESKNEIHQIIYTCEESQEEHPHLSTHHPNADNNALDDKFTKTESAVVSAETVSTVKNDYSLKVRQAFKQAYKLTDKILSYGGDERSRVRWSSCSALTVLFESLPDFVEPERGISRNGTSLSNDFDGAVTDFDKKSNLTEVSASENVFDPPQVCGRLHIAYAGNVQAVLVRDNRSYLLTKSHSYLDSRERRRIQEEGGMFSQSEQEMRVNGVSATTRSLGNHGDPKLKRLVIWEPKCSTVPIDQYAQFLILATNGIWEVFSPQTAAELLLQMLPSNRLPSPGYVSPSIDKLLFDRKDQRSEIDSDRSIRGLRASPASDKAQLRTSVVSEPRNIDNFCSLELNGFTADNFNRTENSSLEPSAKLTARAESVVMSLPGSVEPADNIDGRSDDSGNEADVDTDWASTSAPADLGERTISSRIEMHRQFSRLLAERLVQCALLAGAKDNISAVVVVLPGTRL